MSVLILRWVLPNSRVFPLTSLSLVSSQLLMRTPRVRLARHTGLLALSRSTFVI